MEYTGERYVPEIEDVQTGCEHWHRYLFAREFAAGKRVLDVACGEGYGSHLLAQVAREVVGIDLSEEAIAHASSRYHRPNLRFSVGSTDDLRLAADKPFDLVVSFETIEHISEEGQRRFLAEVRRVMSAGGLLIVSTPNKLTYSDLPKYSNPFHLKEFYADEFRSVLEEHFERVTLLGQKVYPGSHIWPIDEESDRVAEYGLDFGEHGLRPSAEGKEVLYVLALCSDHDVGGVGYSVALDLSSQLFRRRDEQLTVLHRIVAERDLALRSLEAELATARDRGAQLEAHVLDFEAKTKSLEVEFAASQGRAMDLELQVRALAAKVGEFEAQVRELGAGLAEARSMAAVQEAEGREREGQLRERDRHISSMMEEIEWYTTGFLPSVFRWARGWAIRNLPLGSRRRLYLTLAAKAVFTLVREGPGSLRRRVVARLRSRKGRASPAPPAPEAAGEGREGANGEATGAGFPEGEAASGALQQALEIFLSNPTSRLKFPRAQNPRVSIVVCVHNKAELTYQCLESIRQHTEPDFEMIVVDDASTDQTRDLLARLEDATVHRNQANQEFVQANNTGARGARGEYLLFLNNDVRVTPGWLESLVGTMERFPEAGAVGSKLVWPNGTLQEAGSIVWADGSCLGYGRGDDPQKPEYNHLREVDFCSAACLLVRADLFRKAGFFDLRYAPAFYEDADLCFAVRAQGYKVYYQPQSKVIHYEFGSRSPERAFRLCSLNQVKFFEKWNEALKERRQALPQDALAVLDARDLRRGKRVLFMDDMIPSPGMGSGFPRSRMMLEFLVQLGSQPTFLPLTDSRKLQPDAQMLQNEGVEVFYDAWADPEALLRSRAGWYDVIIISRPHNGHRLLRKARRYNPSALLIYDAEAVFAMRDILKAELDGHPFSESQKVGRIGEETAIMSEADVVVTVSEAERDLILQHSPHNRVMVWGHSHPVAPPETAFEHRRDLLFVGGFAAGHPPNTDAVTYFCKEVLPLLRKRNPEIRLHIVGSNAGEPVLSLASEAVVVVGFVEDLREYYEKCRVFVAPVRFGAGINLKVVDAMSYGIPAVVSTFVASGLGLEQGAEVMVAGTPGEYVERILRLYEDESLWSRLSMASTAFIQRNYSPEIMKQRLAEILETERER
ncbi:MAG TPA: glycosyltransferase [Anaerolineales bacterium]|nr:glycosyltransferase [Anaerolineales bacterium]